MPEDEGGMPKLETDREVEIALEDLEKPVPWLDHTAVKLSPLIFAAGVLGYGFRHGYSKQLENYRSDEFEEARQRRGKKKVIVGKVKGKRRVAFSKYEPRYNAEGHARKLALRALGVSTLLVGSVFLAGAAAVGMYFNVTSIREFSQKMTRPSMLQAREEEQNSKTTESSS